jgi:hypothetical protein
MKASAKKFIAFVHRDQRRPGEWVGVLTWRIGFRGPFLVHGGSETEIREKLARLDPTIRFHDHSRRKNRGGDDEKRKVEKAAVPGSRP